MKISTIFYHPILLLFLCSALSLATTLYIHLGFDIFWQFVALVFVYYLLISLINNIQLVARGIVPWYFFLLIPVIFFIVGLISGISWDTELSRTDNVIIGISFTGLGQVLIELIMSFQIKKTRDFIRKNLKEYIISENALFPHIMAQTKYIFKDFTASIIKMAGLKTEEVAALSIAANIVKPTRGMAAAGAMNVAISRALQKQVGNQRSYFIEIYLEKNLNKIFNVNEPGFGYMKKAFFRGQFDDKNLREIASKIDSQFESNIYVIYLFKYPQEKYPLIRLTLSPKYFEADPKKVYSLIAELKSNI